MIEDNRLHNIEDYKRDIEPEVWNIISDLAASGISVRVFHSDFGDVDFVFEVGDKGFQWPIELEFFDERFESNIMILKGLVKPVIPEKTTCRNPENPL